MLDEKLLQSQTKTEMFMIIHEHQQFLRNRDLKAALDKTHFLSGKAKFLGL